MCSICADARWRLALGAWILILAACAAEQGAPETRIRELVDAMQAAVERRSLQDAAVFLDADYRDQRHASKREAVATLFAYLRRNRQIHLFTSVRELRLSPNGEGAQLQVAVAMAGVPIQSLDALISVRADLYLFELALVVAEDNEWRIRQADWQRVRAADLLTDKADSP